jgi:hypothetical protein
MSVGVNEDLYMSVGVMKDYKMKERDLHVSYSLGCVGEKLEHLKIVTRLIDERFTI